MGGDIKAWWLGLDYFLFVLRIEYLFGGEMELSSHAHVLSIKMARCIMMGDR